MLREGNTNLEMVAISNSLDSINHQITHTENDFIQQKQQSASKEPSLSTDQRLQRKKKSNNLRKIKQRNESATEKEARLEKRRRKMKKNLETDSIEKRD